jgi:hypothetical protein
MLANHGTQDFLIAALNRDFQLQKITYSKNSGFKKLTGALPHDARFVFYGEYLGDFSYEGKDFPWEILQPVYVQTQLEG